MSFHEGLLLDYSTQNMDRGLLSYNYINSILLLDWAVVVAQLAERSLPTQEIRGSNPDIGNISNFKHIYLSIAIQKRRK